MKKADVIIIGGGAAGLMAAYGAASKGADTVVLEKMPRPARKIMITGKGRCNFTNMKPWNEFQESIHPQSAFLRPSFQNLTPQMLYDFFESCGMPSVVERGDRAFPVSHQASDVVDTLVAAAQDAGAKIVCSCAATNIIDDSATGGFIVNCSDGSSWRCARVIVTTGGMSYPKTGSTGDGYAWAEAFGHRISPIFPTLTALVPKDYRSTGETISLKNVGLRSIIDGAPAQEEFGDVDFTSGGLEGPLGFRISRKCVKAMLNGSKVQVEMDLKPVVEIEELSRRVARLWDEISADRRSEGKPYKLRFGVLLGKLLPMEFIPLFMAGNPDLDHKRLPAALKCWRLDIAGNVGWERCVVTAGGVCLDEINRKSLESKKRKGLHFAGEVLDLDADTGGYNLHVAFCTGYLAGLSAAERLRN